MEKPVSTFICAGCDRQELVPYAPGSRAAQLHIPQGWDVTDDAAICPDCVNASLRIASLSLSPVSADPETYVFKAAARPEPPFAICLAQQLPGQYSVALSPARVLTLYQPLAYLLDADEALALAKELIHHAELVRRPGTLGAAA